VGTTALKESAMGDKQIAISIVCLGVMACSLACRSHGAIGQSASPPSRPARPADAVEAAQRPEQVEVKRVEQRKTERDAPQAFTAANAMPSSPALEAQPESGRISGFDFARDPLNAKRPGQTFEEIMAEDVKMRPAVMAAQRRLLESRYDLVPRLHATAKMSRGKPVPMGPTARLTEGMDWGKLASMSPEEIRKGNLFPYPSLPHPKHTPGGQVFPRMQIDMFPRLERFDVEFDIPDPFLPEFPPAMFLQNRPDCAGRRCSSARGGAHRAIRLPSTSITRCTT
jgi:hypothetical protein